MGPNYQRLIGLIQQKTGEARVQIERAISELTGVQGRDIAEVSQDLLENLKEYTRQNPEKAALWCLCIGFVLGWKLKPW